MNDASCRSHVRLAELVATLSLGTDLGLGQPMEHVLRQCLIALRMSERLGFSEAERRVVYYSGLLAWVGCYADAYEQAKWFGDDIALKADAYEMTGPEIGYLLTHLGSGKPILERLWLGLTFMGDGRRAMNSMLENHCLATVELTRQLGLGDDVSDSLKQSFERWDGKYSPMGLKGEEILLTSRLIQLANVVEVFHRKRGVDAAVAVARDRSGSELDPSLVQLFCDIAPDLFDGFDAATTWDTVIASEPSLAAVISDDQFEHVLESIGDFIDLKSPYTIGHSRGVADLATEAARLYGLPGDEVIAIRRAGLVHDFGRLGVSNGIWDKRGPLSQGEIERVHLHPYLSQRMLAFSPALAPLGAIAVQHHERMDGSGYPRGISGDAITQAGRILAAADSYHAMTELRPYRPARSPEDAAAELRAEVAAGRIDGDAADAVLRAAGHGVKRRREWPAELTTREVEVLRLVACGYSNREIANQLTISHKTAGNHVEHIYMKIGVSNRARASLFAMKHGLMSDQQPLEFA
jgi:HD-GYP domain-containing protein (c-di-GMP phosphodiesterase class II)/DNA-binding CsgD family transcriptional regulator